MTAGNVFDPLARFEKDVSWIWFCMVVFMLFSYSLFSFLKTHSCKPYTDSCREILQRLLYIWWEHLASHHTVLLLCMPVAERRCYTDNGSYAHFACCLIHYWQYARVSIDAFWCLYCRNNDNNLLSTFFDSFLCRVMTKNERLSKICECRATSHSKYHWCISVCRPIRYEFYSLFNTYCSSNMSKWKKY